MIIDLLVILLLAVGAVASGVFAIDYLRTANLKLKVAHQIISLNAAIAGVLFLTLMGRFELLTSDIRLYMQMFLFVFIDAALIYQLVMLRQARRLGKQHEHIRTDD